MSIASVSQLVISAEIAMRNSNFLDAVQDFSEAVKIKSDDAYLIQQYALATYKNKLPTPLAALHKAREIIQPLNPQHSTDAETLAIAGSIHKKLWLITWNADDLARAEGYYKRGFEQDKNYYCGENYALCLNLRASSQRDINLQMMLNVQAHQIREALIKILYAITEDANFVNRTDKKWVLATLANTFFALGRTEEGLFYEGFLFMEKYEVFSQWERDTYEFEKLQLMKLLNSKHLKADRQLQ